MLHQPLLAYVKSVVVYLRELRNTIYNIYSTKQQFFLTEWNLGVRSNVPSCFIRKCYVNLASHYREPDKVNCEMTYIQQYTKKYWNFISSFKKENVFDENITTIH